MSAREKIKLNSGRVRKGLDFTVLVIIAAIILTSGIVSAFSFSDLFLFNFQTEKIQNQITILNPQSYPAINENWTVHFETIGTADLTIKAINGTEFGRDLEFLEIRCGNQTLDYSWINSSVFIPDYSCPETGYEISKVLTAGKHALKFKFGDDVEYS